MDGECLIDCGLGIGRGRGLHTSTRRTNDRLDCRGLSAILVRWSTMDGLGLFGLGFLFKRCLTISLSRYGLYNYLHICWACIIHGIHGPKYFDEKFHFVSVDLGSSF
ncbi:hypothetical protein BDW62DRAFT_178452 [Aspergillus aurantiobrunneus]